MASRVTLGVVKQIRSKLSCNGNLQADLPKICQRGICGFRGKITNKPTVLSVSRRLASTQTAVKPDYEMKYEEKQVAKAWYDIGREMMVTEWQEGERMDFPILWLRDNCQCPACFHPSARARLFLMTRLDLDVTPAHIQTANGEVTINWSDGHQSKFSSSWLYERRFTEDAQEEHRRWLPRKPVLWRPDAMQDNIPRETFDRIMNDDRALYEWLCSLEDTGLFLVTGAPTDREYVLRKLAKRVAFLKATNYGKEFTVKAKLQASNAAFTNASLGLHTDLPYYHYCPGVQMLMCIKQVPTQGGENQFADGFYVAEVMREKYPDEFHILTTVPVRFIDVGTDYYEYHKLYSGPVLTLDDDGDVTRVTYNDQVRDSSMSGSADQASSFYKALKLYNSLLYDNHVTTKLQPGEIICFHNYRVLHGRTGFQALADGERHLEGGYIDWDEIFSRRRVLQKNLNL